MTQKKITIGVCGGIAAYKVLLLVRTLKLYGHEVRVICTKEARNFVTPLSLSVLSENPVFEETFDRKNGSWNSHVELANDTDVFIIAPLTINTLSKIVSGQADNLLLLTYFSASCPIILAPAMDAEMALHKVVQENLKKIQSFERHFVIGPNDGLLASGLRGKGRMAEPEEIFSLIQETLYKKEKWAGKNVLITAGPTSEYIDPVRYLTNCSSGKMGIALATVAATFGAKVTLVLGSSPERPPNVSTILLKTVISAEEMYQETKKHAPSADVIILSAAVADYRPRDTSSQKIKKDNSRKKILELVENKDILADIGRNKKNQTVVGFALETENLEKNALKKLESKNADIIVGNLLSPENQVFNNEENEVILFSREEKKKIPRTKKNIVSYHILNFIETHFLT